MKTSRTCLERGLCKGLIVIQTHPLLMRAVQQNKASKTHLVRAQYCVALENQRQSFKIEVA